MLKKIVPLRTVICSLLVLGLLVAVACGAPAEQQASSAPAGNEQQPAAQAQTAPQPAAPQQQAATSPPAAQAQAQPTLAQPAGMADTKTGGAAPTAVPEPAAPKAETEGTPVQADLRVAITPPYAENLLGWRVGGTNQGILQPMQEQLFQRHYETWETQAMLATDWSVSPDGQTWNIKLRENVPFHHGDDTFGVSDFVFSWQLWTHPEAKTGWGPLWNTMLGPGDDKHSWDVDELGKNSRG